METDERMINRPKDSQRMVTEEQLVKEDTELHHPNKEMRPKRNQIIEFKVNGIAKIGKVSQVGKATGKDKNRCWIKLRNSQNKEESYDFVKDVQTWKVIQKVTFSNQTLTNRPSSSQGMEVENDTQGIWFLTHRLVVLKSLKTKTILMMSLPLIYHPKNATILRSL